MQSIYKYRFPRRTIYVSVIYLIVIVLLGWLLYHCLLYTSPSPRD